MKAQTRNITYWLKNIVGFGLIIAAIWLLAFFKESKAGNLHPFIRDYHNQIGFVLFIPFLIIDLVITSILMSMGMMMLPPVIVSLPAKLLVFTLANGWGILAQALVQGFR